MGTFKDAQWSDSLAAKTGLNRDTVRLVFEKAYGNWHEISTYLEKNSREYRSTVLALLMQLSDKDLSDARESILTAHLQPYCPTG